MFTSPYLLCAFKIVIFEIQIVFLSFLALTDGSWVESGARVLKLGVLPVKALLVVGEHVWASSGGQIFIISTQTHTVEVVQHFTHTFLHTCFYQRFY